MGSFLCLATLDNLRYTLQLHYVDIEPESEDEHEEEMDEGDVVYPSLSRLETDQKIGITTIY